MRTVEVEHYAISNNIDDEKYEGNVSILPGGLEVINYLKEVELLVISPIDISDPTIMINGEDVVIERHKLTRDENNEEVYKVEEILPTEKKIKLGFYEELRFLKMTGIDTGKELWVWINSDENESDFIEPEPDPTESLPIKV